jgi:outer membrane receptor protein involved in Fe transport
LNLYDFSGTYVFGDGEGGELELVERYSGRQLGAEARAVWSPGAHSRLTGGAELQYSLVARLQGEEAGGARYLDEDEPTNTIAAYLLLDQQLSPSVQFSAGARADVWSTFGTAISPRLALILKASPQDVTKLMGGRAFRAPSIYELYYNDGGSVQVRSDFGGNELGPEQVWSGELEHTHHFARWWSVLGAGWVNHISGSMLSLPAFPDDPASPVYYANSDTAALAMGLEAELRREFQDSWMIALQGSGQRATYLSEGGEQVPNTPVATGSLRLLAPLVDPLVRLGLRGTVEAPRRINLVSDERTEAAFIGDVVLSGEVTESGAFYNLGLYNFMDWRLAMPVSGNFATPTMPQSGRSLLLTVGVER